MRKTIWVMLLGTLISCEGVDRDQIAPEVRATPEGELAVLPPLPQLLDPEYAWTFRPIREVVTVSAGADEPLVYNPQSLLELRNGTLLVHDPQAEQVLVLLDPVGPSVLRRFGRAGPGPEELGSRLSFVEAPEGLFVLDSRNRQIHRFSLDGTRVSAHTVPFEGAPGKAIGMADGTFLVEVLKGTESGWHRELLRVDPFSEESDFVTRLPQPPAGSDLGRIQRGRILWTTSGDRLAAMWSARPEIAVTDVTGVPIRRIRLPFERRVISERDIQLQVEKYGDFVLNSLEPGPAALTNGLYSVADTLIGMFTSDLWKAADDPRLPVGRVWWRVFSVRGEYLGVVELPEGLWPLGRSEEGIWARVLDDLGYPVMQELKLVQDRSG